MSATAEAPRPAVEQWYTIPEVSGITKFGRTALYQEIGAGRLKSKKVGGARRVSESQLAEWQASFDGSGEK
jgi:excisionase family DNA binding protein